MMLDMKANCPATGPVTPGKMGGHRKQVLLPHGNFILERLIPTVRDFDSCAGGSQALADVIP